MQGNSNANECISLLQKLLRVMLFELRYKIPKRINIFTIMRCALSQAGATPGTDLEKWGPRAKSLYGGPLPPNCI